MTLAPPRPPRYIPAGSRGRRLARTANRHFPDARLMKRYRPPLAATPLVPRPVLADVSLVIPTLGRPVLEDCLQAVAVGDAWPAEIVLVDQGTNPDVEHWVSTLCSAGLTVRHVRAPKRGAAAATNRGIERASSR